MKMIRYIKYIRKYYEDKYKVLYPKMTTPVKTLFDNNIEKVFDIVGCKIIYKINRRVQND